VLQLSTAIPEYPTKASTGAYCLQPLAVKELGTGRDPDVSLCQCDPGAPAAAAATTTSAATAAAFPASLVRLDTRGTPEGLLPLTIVEEQLLGLGKGLGKACRFIFVMRPRGRGLMHAHMTSSPFF
jgi:hypothetical protein